jgi:transposase
VAGDVVGCHKRASYFFTEVPREVLYDNRRAHVSKLLHNYPDVSHHLAI